MMMMVLMMDGHSTYSTLTVDDAGSLARSSAMLPPYSSCCMLAWVGQ